MRTPAEKGPELAAIMCDGAGWFSGRDYKRMLLVFSEILYLLPSQAVEFRDVSGRTELLSFFHVTSRPQSTFRVVHFHPSSALAQAILTTASEDARDTGFQAAVAKVSHADALYTWRVANSDGDLTGESIALEPAEVAAAHSLVLN